MKRQTLLAIYLSLAAVACGAVSCLNIEQDISKFEPVRAEVHRTFDAQSNPILNSHGSFSSQVVVIDDPAHVRKLAAFFPGLGIAPTVKHLQNGSYVPYVQIVFTGANHRVVTVNTDYILWNDGHGDRHVAGGFVQYIDRLFAAPK